MRHTFLIGFGLSSLLILPLAMLLYLLIYARSVIDPSASTAGLASLDARALWTSLKANPAAHPWMGLYPRIRNWFLELLKWLGLLSPGTVIPPLGSDPFGPGPGPGPSWPGDPGFEPPPSDKWEPGRDPLTDRFLDDVPQDIEDIWDKVLADERQGQKQ
jgi:hypothetical protein